MRRPSGFRDAVRLAALGVAWATAGVCPASGGELDRVEGDTLAAWVRSGDARPRDGLSFGDLEALPSPLKATRSAFLVAKTGQGNFARLLVSPAFRKGSGAEKPPVPVVVVEAFATFEPGRASARVAGGRGVVLFPGFDLDLDAGLIVPEGQGGDVSFRAPGGDEKTARLAALPGATLYGVSASAKLPAAASGPASGEGPIVPADFAGSYRMAADGRWRGRLTLEVAKDGREVSGHFRSEPGGASYPVTGEVGRERPNEVTFQVKFPRTEQTYTGYLWGEGKSALAGTFTMTGRAFGFFAVREGAKAPLGDEP